jgi:hypothetical protein
MHDRTFIGLGIAASVLILGYFLFIVIRRIMRSRLISDETKNIGPGFTLPELRQMLEKGLISQTEFENIKKTIINNVRTSDDGKGR